MAALVEKLNLYVLECQECDTWYQEQTQQNWCFRWGFVANSDQNGPFTVWTRTKPTDVLKFRFVCSLWVKCIVSASAFLYLSGSLSVYFKPSTRVDFRRQFPWLHFPRCKWLMMMGYTSWRYGSHPHLNHHWSCFWRYIGEDVRITNILFILLSSSSKKTAMNTSKLVEIHWPSELNAECVLCYDITINDDLKHHTKVASRGEVLFPT